MQVDPDTRKGVMLGEVDRVVFKVGHGEKMKRHPKIGTEVPLALSREERYALRRMGLAEEFVVRIKDVVVDEDKGIMWLVLEPVGVLVEGPKDRLTARFWMR